MNKSKEKIKENPIVANRAIYMANPCHIIDKRRCVVMHDAPSFLFITDINRFIFFKLR